MQLGTLMERLELEDDATAALVALGDIILFTAVQTMGERFEETPGAYVAGAASRFATQASDEDWMNLMTVMERSDDPARSALDKMIRWSLARDAADGAQQAPGHCSCGSGHGGCNDTTH